MSSEFSELTALQQKAYEIIISNLDVQVSEDLKIDSELTDIGFDSITFIKTVVALESEFDFEFDDEKLLITKFPTIKTLIKYVEAMVSTNRENSNFTL